MDEQQQVLMLKVFKVSTLNWFALNHNHHHHLGKQQQQQQVTTSKRFKCSSLACCHRTHKRFEYRASNCNNHNMTTSKNISQKLATLLLLASLSISILIITQVTCLDSPVKVQRYKQQFRQTSEKPKHVLASNSTGNLDQQEAVMNARSEWLNITTSTSAANLTDHNQRVKRTNNNDRLRSSQRRTVDECPTSRLINQLLPGSYIGSPASNQRQQQSRAYCDCQSDLFGWHLTCFAGSQQQQHQDAAQTGELPNQLHPAFRGPQLQRQAQQAASALRRVHRSPSRWMGDNNERVSNASEHLFNLASHEGFGEDDSRVVGNNSDEDQLAALPSSNSFTLMKLDEQESSNDKSTSNNNNNNNIMFQTVPVLFSVKYLRNNMIEIDCDQAAPNYKPAMFQGKSLIGEF